MQTTVRRRIRLALMLVSMALALPLVAQTLPPDLCGCRNAPSLGAFDLRDRNTWPPGTTVSTSNTRFVTIPLPADGVLVFDSMHLEYGAGAGTACCPVELGFSRNAANTPVTLLVKGNVTIASNATFQLRGQAGGNGSSDAAGSGGLGGNGGFRGGDGAYRLGNGAIAGGTGLGPAGGVGATSTTASGFASFVGSTDLLPLVGGSGGGGGRSNNLVTNCSGSGGGGGGGALLLALNGALSMSNTGGSIIADAGIGGAPSGYTCSTGGTGGAGGAIRIIANTIGGSGRIYARGGSRWEDGQVSGDGIIRLEAITNTLAVSFTDPLASRTSVPGPIVNPFTPRVSVTAVGGLAVPALPQGGYGVIDVQVSAPGPTAIDLSTDGVPTGTVVEVKVKPRIGGPAIAQPVTLTNCDGSGHCLATVTIDLLAGNYTVEARATFQQP